jgi:hypothetical protein
MIKGSILLKPILYTMLGVLIVLAVIGGKSLVSNQLPKSDIKELMNEAITPTPTATVAPTNSPSNSPTTKPQIIYKPTPTPLPTNTPTPTQTPQTQIQAPAISIELCKTKAETYKTQTMTALVLVYNQNNADAVKIANTSSTEELVNVGISIGLITTEQYNSDPSGHQLALLKMREKVTTDINSFMNTVNGKGSLAYNDYYTRCLNGEN